MPLSVSTSKSIKIGTWLNSELCLCHVVLMCVSYMVHNTSWAGSATTCFKVQLMATHWHHKVWDLLFPFLSNNHLTDLFLCTVSLSSSSSPLSLMATHWHHKVWDLLFPFLSNNHLTDLFLCTVPLSSSSSPLSLSVCLSLSPTIISFVQLSKLKLTSLMREGRGFLEATLYIYYQEYITIMSYWYYQNNNNSIMMVIRYNIYQVSCIIKLLCTQLCARKMEFINTNIYMPFF